MVCQWYVGFEDVTTYMITIQSQTYDAMSLFENIVDDEQVTRHLDKSIVSTQEEQEE